MSSLPTVYPYTVLFSGFLKVFKNFDILYTFYFLP